MVKIKAIDSVEKFFESIFRHAERSPEGGAWELSDKLGVEKGRSAIKRFILSLLPKKTGEDLDRLSALAIRDIARVPSDSPPLPSATEAATDTPVERDSESAKR